jgi:hypothetical protein
MSKKLLLPVMFALFLITSCKKSPDIIKKINDYKSLDFTATATAPLKVVIKIMRPATDGNGVNVQLTSISQRNITTPYHYTEARLQTGDHINIEVTTDPGKPIIGVLKINGDTKASNYTNLNNADGESNAIWDYMVE